MADNELSSTDLQEYVEEIRDIFDIYEFEGIDIAEVRKIEGEIERRRAIFSHFIPDVFESGKYDRRADLIDGCIYYLEHVKQRGSQLPILDYWAKRAGFSKRFNPKDIEVSSFGYHIYHPLYHILGNPNNPYLFLPRLVRYIRSFRGRRRKLSINDYAMIFFTVFNATPRVQISEKMLAFLKLLHETVEKVPLVENIKLKQFMRDHDFRDVHSFHSEFVRIGARIFSVFERSVFGLTQYVMYCPYPFHFAVDYDGITVAQNFLTSGESCIQEIMFNMPLNVNWKLLYRKFHPATSMHRLTLYTNSHQSFLTFFDPSSQDWNIPWKRVCGEWRGFLNNLVKSEAEVEPRYSHIDPTSGLLNVCVLLEMEGNQRNTYIRDRTHIPIKDIIRIRKTLDEEALAFRTLYLLHSHLDAHIVLRIPGIEEWKYQIIKEIMRIFPISYVFLDEDLVAHDKYFLVNLVHSPKLGISFMKKFPKIFDGVLEYELFERLARPRLHTPSYIERFDSEGGYWRWDPEDYAVRPITYPRTRRLL
jgi:hypothetical protein